MGEFRLTPKQEEANGLLASEATHVLLRGGAGSGKTFVLMRALIVRALRAPGSTHAILRWRFSHLVDSLINNTLPEVLALCFPGLADASHLSKSQHGWSTTFPNGSRILYGGLDDKERADKILGQQHSTIYLNEATQISFDAREKAVTRIRQQSGLPLKMYYDCNPTSTASWLYQLFEAKVFPKSREPIANPEDYVSLQMNPLDNPTLPESYVKQLTSLSGKSKLRFWSGEWLPQVEGALWTFEMIDSNRITPAQLPEKMERVVIAVDPSGCHGPEDERSDEIGIIACGRGKDGRGYVLADRSGRYSPDGWARAALNLFDEWSADRIVAEANFGGAMVKHTIRTARKEAPVSEITASRGKVQRAEPIAALYEQELISHVGRFADLEEQLFNFSISGYMGQTSPDRADACIAAGSLVATKRGDLPIEKIQVGDLVLTRRGYRRVTAARMTSPTARVMRLEASDGSFLIATPDHRIFSGGEWKRLDTVVCGDILATCNDHQPKSSSRASCSSGFLIVQPDPEGSTIRPSSITAGLRGSGSFTSRFGRTPTNAPLCRKDASFTIRTGTRLTTIQLIWNALIESATRWSTSILIERLSATRSWRRYATSPPLGMQARKEGSGILGWAESHGLDVLTESISVRRVARLSKAGIRRTGLGIALSSVIDAWLTRMTNTLRALPARFVAPSFCRTSTETSQRHAPVYAERLLDVLEPAAVYDLTVESEHEFFANGILVHNCIWALTELMVKPQQQIPKVGPMVFLTPRGWAG